LKSIILFNTRDESYSVIGFNYSETEAAQEIDRIKRDMIPVFTLEQDHEFKSEKEVEDLVNKRMKEIKEKVQNKKTDQ
jgi:hypothetical protein